MTDEELMEQVLENQIPEAPEANTDVVETGVIPEMQKEIKTIFDAVHKAFNEANKPF
jgi:hypothetical protein